MAYISPNLVENLQMNLEVLKVQQTLKRINTERATARSTVVKLLKTNGKEKLSKNPEREDTLHRGLL